jgi:hypothetical protein
MAGLNSFRDVIEDMFYNDIFNALSAFVEDNPSRLENNSYRVQIERLVSRLRLGW